MSILRRGDRGGAVVEIRAALAALGLLDSPDADLTTGKHIALDFFDDDLDQAVRAFQQHRGLLVDGIVGEATYRALKEASYRLGARTLSHQFGAPMYGDDVATLQARLQDLGFYTGLVDGHFGLQTHNGLMSYQREYGMFPDGICGPETLRSLYFLGSRVTGGSPHAIREEELVRRSGPRLTGKRIIIDPGRGGEDRGLIMTSRSGPVSEAEVLWDLASRLEGRMTAIGMDTFLSRPVAGSPSDAERAATANAVGADLMISLRCASLPSAAANGVASFYFGNSHGSVSTIGRNLADFIQREVVARSGFRDCRTHGRTWDLLRLTRMPTVQIDIGYVSSPQDRELLTSPGSRDSIAEGILAAVKRLYLLGKNDRPTGTFTFAELLAHEMSVEQAGQAGA
ncbi:N-acetylmuramoyl-L-alanine amidase [Mycobacterium sp. CBMA293]|uniref:N-acetylmuramoyl-L-alanine amidase n=1 Tax=unclassified Mycolicibacterium TaxID=2636767 RepID=UPI0012DC7E6D|nr:MULTISPECIES: N-acetylmuramoyl-L-alanine amidase [unclassified Mycolicibacterium]MUL49767.1 N-acetylmuramoyl-L-alanine amidase [Mycolicibacterium sp. CBMA 360]MUL59593.1 N-acetylmuramoyl-L-alanine amidase [Mycolicibacterium sp. CBMA 335]MUL71318.1 N-acetylmuramoyl-L-alanine amidase [Mycolicibacterium sp. CBMA 311]MUL94961.1 N-acetylmuramoyl-L-alanine amidase [Mycolicibacterium sp. CBMA 230]MUM03799.1 N-acetylmuramoyl-L-alanine amidase [Mycolicibacterium sp. CBMA 213]